MNRAATLWGYAVFALAGLAYQATGLLLHRTPTLAQALATVTRWRAGRLLLLATWLWLGWHAFVRGSYQ